MGNNNSSLASSMAEDYESGLSVQQVSIKHGVCRTTASRHIKQAGIIIRPYRPGTRKHKYDYAAITAGYADGQTIRELAKLHHCDASQIIYVLHKRDYARTRSFIQRADFFTGKVCVDCGSTTRLELDHIDPTQKISHRIWGWKKERREAEIAKCTVRCHTCHVRRHIALQRKSITHGTASGYYWYKCRCDLCKAACSEYLRERRERRKFIGIEPKRRKQIPHGTVGGYSWYKCRCDLCKSAMSVYQHEGYLRRKMTVSP